MSTISKREKHLNELIWTLSKYLYALNEYIICLRFLCLPIETNCFLCFVLFCCFIFNYYYLVGPNGLPNETMNKIQSFNFNLWPSMKWNVWITKKTNWKFTIPRNMKNTTNIQYLHITQCHNQIIIMKALLLTKLLHFKLKCKHFVCVCVCVS